MIRKTLSAALLLAALSARAQVEVRPTLVLPTAPGLFAPPASAAFAPALAPALTMAPLAALGTPAALPPAAAAAAQPAISIPAAAPLPPAQARAAAMTGALAEFARTDLKTASAGESRDAGEALMLRALGASAPSGAAAAEGASETAVPPLAAPEPSARPAETKTYLLSKPLRETVRLGPAAIVLHLAYSLAWEVVKDVAVYAGVHRATGSVALAAAGVGFEIVMSSGMLTARTLADLGQRYWRRKLAVLKDLALTPEVTRVKVLTSGPVAYAGPVARSKDNTGLIFVEANGELPETLGRFGAPIPLGDLSASRVRLAFVQDGKAAAADWTPTLKELLDGRPIPPEISARWRAQANGAKSALKRILGLGKGKAAIEATLISPEGNERAIGAIVEGPPARKLIGLGMLDRARLMADRRLPSRAIPISDSVVERPGDAREPGFMGAARRAWRRVTGRLIVAKR